MWQFGGLSGELVIPQETAAGSIVYSVIQFDCTEEVVLFWIYSEPWGGYWVSIRSKQE